ncbi:ATP-dependent DNA helicase [Trichonephila clavipes]|nr:ATP-dependent DNA helicase [Trichonephila clavipes]
MNGICSKRFPKPFSTETVTGGNTLPHYGLPSPQAIEGIVENLNREYIKHTNFDSVEFQHTINQNEPRLNNEQNQVYRLLTYSVNADAGGVYLLDAPSESELLENPVCSVTKNSDEGKVLQDCVFVVRDECTMAIKISIEDLRVLWRYCKTYKRKHGAHSADSEFSKILLDGGEGKCPEVNSTHDTELHTGQVVADTETLIHSIYDDVNDLNIKEDSWLCERSILAPINDHLTVLHQCMLDKILGESQTTLYQYSLQSG